jgi:hypothetical protein
MFLNNCNYFFKRLEGSSRSVVTKTSGPGTLKSTLMILEKTKEMLALLMKILVLLM